MNNLQSEHQQEILEFNKIHDDMFNEMNDKYNNLIAVLNENNRQEFDNHTKEFDETYPEKNPKNTPEILDLYKKLEGIVKKKQ
jgi:hypothetical protein